LADRFESICRFVGGKITILCYGARKKPIINSIEQDLFQNYLTASKPTLSQQEKTFYRAESCTGSLEGALRRIKYTMRKIRDEVLTLKKTYFPAPSAFQILPESLRRPNSPNVFGESHPITVLSTQNCNSWSLCN
jgi:hypothetical protein